MERLSSFADAIEETRYKLDPLWATNAEEIETLAATQMCPCVNSDRVGGGLAHYAAFSKAHEDW